MDNFTSIQTILDEFIQQIEGHPPISASELPNIDLYMDQVTTFMDEHLEHSRRYPEDKILTKTMINNYAKNHLLPPPVKKKYSKEHLLVLIFIYYFKNLLSIHDIELLLKPLTEKYFQTSEDFDLSAVYKEVCQLEKSRITSVQEDIKNLWEESSHTYQDAPKEDQEYLQLFAFICSLSFDVYIKKTIIEKLIDSFSDEKK